MSFSFKPRSFFPVEVTVPVPNEKGGMDNNKFTAHFKPATTEEIKVLREGDDADAVRKQLVGWEMTDTDTKEVVPYSEETREVVLSIPSAPYHIALAFYRASSGAKAKN